MITAVAGVFGAAIDPGFAQVVLQRRAQPDLIGEFVACRPPFTVLGTLGGRGPGAQTPSGLHRNAETDLDNPPEAFMRLLLKGAHLLR